LNHPVAALLPMSLDAVRAGLNVTPGMHSRAAHAVWQAIGGDPYDLLGKKAA
jgi:ubiquinone biosynthesis protein COQ4